jgi:hypothetical protein
LAAALAEIGGGGAHGSLGVGWTEPRLVAQSGVSPRLMATALGPNAETVIQASPVLRRRFGFDPLSAQRLISIGGSYAFGLRLDGVGAPALRDALTRVGGHEKESDGSQLLDVGPYAQVPAPLLQAGVLGLGARDVFDPELTVLAISLTARAALLGRGDRLIDEPIYRAAADCLGEVVAARMINERHLLSVEFGVDLVAIGIARDREILCLLGGSADRALQIADNLRSSLAPDARDPRTDQPISDLIRRAEVTTGSYEEVPVVRAEITPLESRPSGFLFGAIARGSLVQLVNGA